MAKNYSEPPGFILIRATSSHIALVICCFIASLVSAGRLHAQVEQIGNMVGVPQKIHELRAAQARLAVESDIIIRVKDEGMHSSTMISRGVPLELRDKIIATENDLIDLLDELYLYYGFTGTETLEFQRSYPVFGDMTYEFR